MGSDEERLEEMLKAVMETDDATVSDQNEWDMVDPLALLDMSEEEIDQVLEKEAEAGVNEAVSEKPEEPVSEDKGLPELPEVGDELSDIQESLPMPEIHEPAAEDKGAAEELSPGNAVPDAENMQDLLELTPAAEPEMPNEPKEEPKEEPAKEPEKEKKKKEKKPKKAKKEKKAPAEGKEKKEGFGKKMAALFFGSDDDELDAGDAEKENTAAPDGDQAEEEKGKNGKAAKKEKKKKEKKKKPAKKNEPDPKKAAKEKQQKAKNAEKAKKKAEKAEKAEKERRAAKKLPKKKVIAWILFCASIAAGILLMNSVGMDTLRLTEARNAFYDKDFETAYKLLNGRILEEEDQLLFRQSSAIMHLKHAEDTYENHLKLEKPVMALEDLLKGVDKYQEIKKNGQESLITPELTEQYQNILNILQEKYSLSEDGALEINALEDDYEYSLQLEALVNGEVYLSQTEIEQQEEEAAQAYPDLEDILPEEEEYLNDSGN